MDKRTGEWLSDHSPVRFMCREPNPGREILLFASCVLSRQGGAGMKKNEPAAWSGKFEICRQSLQGDPEKQEETSFERSLFSDADRTQTCNLLIRSQMLYSIKLRRLSLIASANVA